VEEATGSWPVASFYGILIFIMKICAHYLIFIFLAVAALAGCSRGGSPTVVVTQESQGITPAAVEKTAEVPETPDAAYPGPTEYVYLSPTPASYPEPQPAQQGYTPLPFTVPTPSSGSGVVVGQMIDQDTGEPMQYVYVYLGKRIYLTPGPGYTYGLQENSSPHAQTNDKGQFAIADAPPGTYLLMIFTPRSASVVMEPNTDREMDIVVTAGETLELGEVEAVPPSY